MKSPNRWLLIFGVVIGALALTAVALVLTLNQDSPLLPVDTPAGVVQRFILALKENDYETAESYLSAALIARQGSTPWKDYYPSNYDPPAWQATLGETIYKNQTAIVPVTLDTFHSGSPLANSVYSRSIAFTLVTENGVWKIDQPDYFWGFFY